MTKEKKLQEAVTAVRIIVKAAKRLAAIEAEHEKAKSKPKVRKQGGNQ
jgi:hypothetical protein